MKELQLGEVLDLVDSRSPTPGGGSVAALVGEFGLCLARMYGHLSIHKKAFQQLDEQTQRNFLEIHRQLGDKRKKMEELALKDMEAYEQVVKAIANKQGIEESLKMAFRIPCELIELSYQTMEEIEEILKDGNQNVISDALAGLCLLYATIECSYLNVVINARSLHLSADEEQIVHMKELMKKASELKEKQLFDFYDGFI